MIAAFIWGYAAHVSTAGLDEEAAVAIVSFSGGALLANIVSVVFLVAETMTVRR